MRPPRKQTAADAARVLNDVIEKEVTMLLLEHGGVREGGSEGEVKMIFPSDRQADAFFKHAKVRCLNVRRRTDGPWVEWNF